VAIGLFLSRVQHVGVNHQHAHVRMPKPFLEPPAVVTILGQIHGKQMVKGVTTHRFGRSPIIATSYVALDGYVTSTLAVTNIRGLDERDLRMYQYRVILFRHSL
jgi:hypothetical protein